MAGILESAFFGFSAVLAGAVFGEFWIFFFPLSDFIFKNSAQDPTAFWKNQTEMDSTKY